MRAAIVGFLPILPAAFAVALSPHAPGSCAGPTWRELVRDSAATVWQPYPIRMPKRTAVVDMSIDYRAEFDIPRDVCYLNAAYMTPQPRRAVEAAIRGARYRAQPWRITPPDFFAKVEDLRAAFARRIACAPDNVAIVPSAGYGVSCAALNVPAGTGDVILGMHDQFPSNYYAWCRRAPALGMEFHSARPEAG